VTSSKSSKGQAGNPRFLERVSWCVSERCRLLGLYAPRATGEEKPAAAQPAGGTAKVEFDLEKWRQLPLEERIRRLRLPGPLTSDD
jgi:hypothetical protein